MVDLIDESSQLESNTIGVFRSAATVKGGRRFSFGALVIVGDRAGRIGVGYAKANEVPPAVDKAMKNARRAMQPVNLKGTTIPHEVTGRFGASVVRMVPAREGTGVIAGNVVRAVLEAAGVRDVLTKSYGSNSAKNLVKATQAGLESLRGAEMIERLRGVKLATG